MLTAGIVLGILAAAAHLATHFMRNVMNTRRERARGYGGTQDIAMLGLLVTILMLIASLICLSLATQSLRR